MFIRSERLFLRPGWPEDWEEVFAGINDEAVIRNLARVPWPYTAEDAKTFLSRPHDRLFPRFLLTLPGSGGARVIGGAGIQREGDDVELGYWVARQHWGKGYATEAARAVLCVARSLGHRRVLAGHFADNPASARVLQKVGFRANGRTLPRHSLGRAGEAPMLGYEIALDAVSGDGDDDKPTMQHAA